MTEDDSPNHSQTEEEKVSGVKHLLNHDRFRKQTTQYNKVVKEQWERLQNVDPDLTKTLELAALSRKQLNVFCWVTEMIQQIPNQIHQNAFDNLDTADFHEEVEQSRIPIGNIATRFAIILSDKSDRPAVKDRIAKLLFLIRQT